MKKVVFLMLLAFAAGMSVYCLYVKDAAPVTYNVAVVAPESLPTCRLEQVQASFSNTVVAVPRVLSAQVGDTPNSSESFADFLKSHWLALLGGLLSFLEIVVRLTPSERDNSILNFIKMILDGVFPNRKNPDGTHP